MSSSSTTKNKNSDSNGAAAAAARVSKNDNNESSKDKDDEPPKMTTIQEGSAQMSFPATKASTVFYNPVQVQNRDLSILMITLYSERRRRARQEKRAKKQQKQQQVQATKTEPDNNNGDKSSDTQDSPNKNDAAAAADDEDDEDGMSILEALAASGLRSIRYWNEIPSVRHVMINDLDAVAVERAHDNIALNKLSTKLVQEAVDPVTHQRPAGIRIHRGDALHELYLSRRPQQCKITPENAALELAKQPSWDVIDLDPYGSAAFLLDATIQAVEDGGFLCITCTDMAALGGSHPETCFGRYASMPIQRAGYLHEFALRALLYSIATTAARYGRTIRPILSVGMDFYVRVFVEVYNDKAGVNALSLQIGSVFQSTQCPAFFTVPAGQLGGKKNNVYQAGRLPVVTTTTTATAAATTGDDKTAATAAAAPLAQQHHPLQQCEETGGTLKMAGPIWLGPLHDKEVVGEALKRLEGSSSNSDKSHPKLEWLATKDRLRGLLTSCYEELDDAPLYYRIPDLSQCVKSSSPPLLEFQAALMNAGYRVSGFHKEAQAVKTNAPSKVVFDVLRAWCRKNPPKKTPAAGSAAEKILSQPVTISNVDWTVPAALLRQRKGTTKNSSSKGRRLARFPQNPEANWGPKAKAQPQQQQSGQKRKAEQTPDKKDEETVE